MDKGRYSIIFSSLTGNTKILAETIRAVLPAENCDYYGVPETQELHSEILYIGFWTDKGNADNATLETSLDKGTQRKTTENELPSLTQCTA